MPNTNLHFGTSIIWLVGSVLPFLILHRSKIRHVDRSQ